jgi:hypothetical protein
LALVAVAPGERRAPHRYHAPASDRTATRSPNKHASGDGEGAAARRALSPPSSPKFRVRASSVVKGSPLTAAAAAAAAAAASSPPPLSGSNVVVSPPSPRLDAHGRTTDDHDGDGDGGDVDTPQAWSNTSSPAASAPPTAQGGPRPSAANPAALACLRAHRRLDASAIASAQHGAASTLQMQQRRHAPAQSSSASAEAVHLLRGALRAQERALLDGGRHSVDALQGTTHGGGSWRGEGRAPTATAAPMGDAVALTLPRIPV